MHAIAAPNLARAPSHGVVAGVAAGVGRWLGVEPVFVRAAFIASSLAFGAGIFIYGALWAYLLEETDDTPARTMANDHRRVGLGLMFLGAMLGLRAIGLWVGDGVVWPLSAVVFGAAFLLDQRDIDSRDAIARLLDPVDGTSRFRIAAGAVLVLVGFTLFAGGAAPTLAPTVIAVVITMIGLTLVFSPVIWRLATDLGAERRERVRQEERAEMAAHLHDSVLQTLALIQRTEDPKRMLTLARAQERELRGWLYERVPDVAGEPLSSVLRDSADRIDEDFQIPVEVVTVGDLEVDDAMRAVGRAAAEAMINAAKHSGADRISVYAEVGDEAVDVFVSDLGKGFDQDAVPEDRRGISDSIVARMERHGGTAVIASEPGEGTEVQLRMPRNHV